jgi:ABC-type multidrug transport system fused ATPase/permease subunit
VNVLHGKRRPGANRRSRRVRARGWHALTGLFRTFLRPYAWQLSLLVILLTIQAVGNLSLPNLNADIINNGVVKGDVGYIWRTGGLMLGIAVALGVLSVVAVYWASRVSTEAGASMRAAIYQRVQAFSASEMNRFGIPSLITRNINDVQQVTVFLQMTLTLLLIAFLMSVGGVIMAVRESAALSLLLVVAVPLMVLFTGAILISVLPLFRSLQVKIDRINQVVREQITGVRVIRAFVRTSSEQDRFQEVNADITRIWLRASRIFAVIIPVLTVILNLSSVGLVWFGGRLVSEGSMPIGNLTAFLVYIVQILLWVPIAVTVVMQAPRAAASAERIEQVINVVPAIADPARPVLPVRVTGTVEFRHVTFGYPGSERPVLNDLTFILRPGQTSGIIGGTGSGKTTLLNLIPRFFDATAGAVLVHGTDIREQSVEQLWSTIGLVPQAAFLFGGTVASNLRFGWPEATDEQLWRALDIAHALDFVASMPGQLDALIDQGGSNVSGGQRQRLAIARALVRRPRLYLFDDCFSALDAATDARLRGALRAETRDATVVIVAQRVSTIMHADQIIVIDAGSVVGIGSHRRLLADCWPYREIVESQLGEGAAV